MSIPTKHFCKILEHKIFGMNASKLYAFTRRIYIFIHRVSFFHHNSWNGKKAVGANLFVLCLKFRIRCEVGIRSANNLPQKDSINGVFTLIFWFTLNLQGKYCLEKDHMTKVITSFINCIFPRGIYPYSLFRLIIHIWRL